MSAPRVVPCPGCGALAPFAAHNTFRPFCSARCRTIDLGQWAAEGYRIAEAQPADPQEGLDSPGE